MVDILLAISILILVYLSAYALIFLGLSFFAFWPKPPRSTFLKQPSARTNNPIAVLIPSHNEGEGLVDAVETTYKQDYPGAVDIYILLNDEKNNAAEIKALQQFYHFDISRPADYSLTDNSNFQLILNKNNRRVYLVFSRLQAKKDKINFILDYLRQPYIAILDADHRPAANWLSSSQLLLTGEVAAVQTRRRPLSTSHLAQIWDSGQNHLGNELFNNFLRRLFARRGGSVFLRARPLYSGRIF